MARRGGEDSRLDPFDFCAAMTSETDAPTLFLVDDDGAFRSAMGGAFTRRGYAVALAADAAEAEVIARAQAIEYAIVDVRMPGGSGIDLVATLRTIDEGTRIIVLTGYGTITSAVAAMRAGAFDYLTKPVDVAICERALLGGGPTATRAKKVPSVERVEWEYLQRGLADCGGNISEVSRRLRLHRRSVQRRLAKPRPR
jgi:two-component system response regulator RegA